MHAPAAPASGWVTASTGATLSASREVAALALRRNPKRAHLLVSSLLGKHVPAPAAAVIGAAEELGARVRRAVDGTPYVLGFAETATGLGHGVARVCARDAGPAPYAHTTRRPVPVGITSLSFEEEHSHAVEQVLAIRDDLLLRDPEAALVLVDDELSSGRTAVNAIRVLQARWPRRHYVLASLLDVRSEQQRAGNVAEVAALGAELTSVTLSEGQVHLPPGLPAVVASLVAASPRSSAAVDGPEAPVTVRELIVAGPLTAAHGWDLPDEQALRSAAELLAAQLDLNGSVLVLGDEEFLYLGQLVAQRLGSRARTSSTTRSPALAVDELGYPLRTVLRFPSSDDARREAFAYNVSASAQPDRGPAPGFDSIVLLLDRPLQPHTRAGLVRRLAAAAGDSVHVVVVRSGLTGSDA